MPLSFPKMIHKDSKYGVVFQIIGIICVVGVLSLLFFVSGVHINNNSAKHLTSANRIFQGQDPGLLWPNYQSTRGPVFPLLIVLSFALFGKSVYSAMLAVRFFFIAGILLVYSTGRISFGRTAGFVACCLALTSPGLNLIAGFLDTDIVLPFFILIFLSLYFLSFHRESRLYSLSTGICLGLAILLKESAVIFLALPAILPVFFDSGRRNTLWKRCLFLYAGSLVVILPWGVWLTIQYGSPMPILGAFHPKVYYFSFR